MDAKDGEIKIETKNNTLNLLCQSLKSLTKFEFPIPSRILNL